MPTPDLAVVVVNHNAGAFLERCVALGVRLGGQHGARGRDRRQRLDRRERARRSYRASRCPVHRAGQQGVRGGSERRHPRDHCTVHLRLEPRRRGVRGNARCVREVRGRASARRCDRPARPQLRRDDLRERSQRAVGRDGGRARVPRAVPAEQPLHARVQGVGLGSLVRARGRLDQRLGDAVAPQALSTRSALSTSASSSMPRRSTSSSGCAKPAGPCCTHPSSR